MTMIKEKELINYLKKKKKIILYGAGMVGGLVKTRLESNNLDEKVDCYIKTAVSGPEKYMGINVVGLDSIEEPSEDTIILVCALAETGKSMIQELEIRNISNYIVISGELFADLEEHYLEEQRLLMREATEKRYDVIFFSQDNNATSGAFISMGGLCDEIQKKSGLRILVVLPRYGDGEKILRKFNLDYTYMRRRTEWIRARSAKLETTEEKSIYNAQEVEELRSLIRNAGTRLIHISGIFVFAGAIAAREEGIPVIWHIRENIFTQGNCFINEKEAYKLLNASRAVVCVSNHIYQAYSGLDENVVRIIYNGADDGKFYKRRDIFLSLMYRILMVGHITQLKGQEILIRALGCLKDKNMQLPQVIFVGGSEAGYLDYLREIMVCKGLERYITFVGRTQKPEIYYKQADIAVSATSGGEGFDRVRIESMLSGCLLIANDLGAAREIVEDGQTGYLYESGNADSLANAIIKVLRDIKKSREIAVNGQRLCMEKFTKSHNAEQILTIYREIMGTKYGGQPGIPTGF